MPTMGAISATRFCTASAPIAAITSSMPETSAHWTMKSWTMVLMPLDSASALPPDLAAWLPPLTIFFRLLPTSFTSLAMLLAADALLLAPILSWVPLNMLISRRWRALASSPMAMKSARVSCCVVIVCPSSGVDQERRRAPASPRSHGAGGKASVERVAELAVGDAHLDAHDGHRLHRAREELARD